MHAGNLANLHHFLWQVPHGGLDLWHFDQTLHGFHHICAPLQSPGYAHHSYNIHMYSLCWQFRKKDTSAIQKRRNLKSSSEITISSPLHLCYCTSTLTKLIPHPEDDRVHMGFGGVQLWDSSLRLNYLLCKNHTYVLLALFGSIFDGPFDFLLLPLNI